MGAHQKFDLGVTVVEAGPRILGGLPETVAAKAARELERRGVTLAVNAKVE
ncbi:MAG TPA: NAD-binding protein [Brevundimonas sp.]